MTKPFDVARLLIHLAAQEPEPDYLTHLRLQKLLYYVQGWSLATRNRPMFDDRIEAWKNGPVVRSLYPRFAEYGKKPIPPDDFTTPDGLDADDRAFVASVWEAYKPYSAPQLWRMTHAERPYLEARGNVPADAQCDAEISQRTMRDFFRCEYDRRHVPGFELDAVERARADIAAGRGVKLTDLARELGHAV